MALNAKKKSQKCTLIEENYAATGRRVACDKPPGKRNSETPLILDRYNAESILSLFVLLLPLWNDRIKVAFITSLWDIFKVQTGKKFRRIHTHSDTFYTLYIVFNSILSVKVLMPTTMETISLTEVNSFISFYMNVHRFDWEWSS